MTEVGKAGCVEASLDCKLPCLEETVFVSLACYPGHSSGLHVARERVGPVLGVAQEALSLEPGRLTVDLPFCASQCNII